MWRLEKNGVLWVVMHIRAENPKMRNPLSLAPSRLIMGSAEAHPNFVALGLLVSLFLTGSNVVTRIS